MTVSPTAARLIRKWPPELYSAKAVAVAVLDQLQQQLGTIRPDSAPAARGTADGGPAAADGPDDDGSAPRVALHP